MVSKTTFISTVAICRGGAHSTSCSITAGRVVHKDGRIVTRSGGTCSNPYTCINCEHGYFFNTGYNGFCDGR